MTRLFVSRVLAVAGAAVTLAVAGCGPVPDSVAPDPEPTPRHHGRHHPGDRTPDSERPARPGPDDDVPAKVLQTLWYVDEHHRAPDGYEGGRAFHNAGRALPVRDPAGRPIRYHEWDVNPRREGVNRGAERLITGSDGSAWYTADHYRTFQKVR